MDTDTHGGLVVPNPRVSRLGIGLGLGLDISKKLCGHTFEDEDDDENDGIRGRQEG
jgi:hypothetical protein